MKSVHFPSVRFFSSLRKDFQLQTKGWPLSLRVLHYTQRATLVHFCFRCCWKNWSPSFLAVYENRPPTRVWLEYKDVVDTRERENLTGTWNVFAPENVFHYSVYWLLLNRNSWERYRKKTDGNVFSKKGSGNDVSNGVVSLRNELHLNSYEFFR